MDLTESNEIFKQLLNDVKPFLITRLGLGAETAVSYLYTQNINVPPHIMRILSNNAGIYNTKGNLREYVEKYIEAIKNSTYLTTWRDTNSWGIQKIQNAFMNMFNLKQLHTMVLEPFYCVLNKEEPWSHKLLGKKVLIIHPFVDSMKKQMNKNFRIFKNKKIFLEEQEFIFYKTYQTQAGNHIHSSWKETFEIMRSDIKKIDFDIALLGCGGYGLPLSNFIYKDMGKSAIYIGGGLQLLFGIMGNRWENSKMWREVIKNNNTKFIRPSGDEICSNKERVENSCYW
jgi:hypothetical protein|tara:strand:+ start:8686 stop:9540 length:855 start_codon:yes stop_codon:yes gene_type:complete